MKQIGFLAIDLGASGGKCFAGIFERGAFLMREIHRFSHECMSFHIPDNRGAAVERMYWDDIFIYANIISGLRAYRREVGDNLAGIGIDTWGTDGQFITKEGEMLGKIYAYRDHRLDSMIEEVKNYIRPERLYAITGIHFQPFNISNQILWFLKNRKNLLLPGCRFLPLPSVFYFYLGGIAKVDSSWASVTQLMDARSKSWSSEVVGKLGIPLEIMPEIVEPGTIIGRLQKPIAESLRLNQADLIAVASHDTASAYAAAPVVEPSKALIISSGTWSLVGKLVPEPVTTPEACAENLSNEGGIGNIRLLKNCMGSWLVHELRRLWRDADGKEMQWSEIYLQANKAPAFSALIDPDYPGFYNPPDMEKALAAYCKSTGQTMPVSRGGILRMVYESLALKYRELNEIICEASGQEANVIHIVGGGSRNEMLNQFTANALSLPVIAGPVEATAVGNILVQALAKKIISSLKDALPLIKHTFPIKEYQPKDTKLWNEAYERFKSLM